MRFGLLLTAATALMLGAAVWCRADTPTDPAKMPVKASDDPKPAGDPKPPADKVDIPKPPEPGKGPEAEPAKVPAGSDKGSLKEELFGTKKGPDGGLQKVDAPRLPPITLKGIIRSQGKEPVALLEIKDVGRYVVRKGSQIPIMVSGQFVAVRPGVSSPGTAPAVDPAGRVD